MLRLKVSKYQANLPGGRTLTVKGSVKAKIMVQKFNHEFGWFRPSNGGMTEDRFYELQDDKNNDINKILNSAASAMNDLHENALLSIAETATEADYELRRRQLISSRVANIEKAEIQLFVLEMIVKYTGLSKMKYFPDTNRLNHILLHKNME